MPEYSCELPLWLADWWDLGLSPQLLNRLADWQQVFDDSFHYETGWSSRDAMESWATEANALVAALEAALPESVTLTVDLWPLGTSD